MRAIDGDRLIDSLESAKRGRGIEVDLVYSLIQEGIRQLPTLSVDDLRPKGRWINWGKSGTPTYENYGTCSVCHEDAEIHTEHRNYCPNFGAKMDGGNNGNP